MIEVEPSYEAWKAYALEHGVSRSVISYLDIRPEDFYKVETTVDGLTVVTPRAWEDLSEILQYHEELGLAVSEELTTRMNTAANIITTAGNTLGTDSAEVQAAQTALNDFSACLEAVQNGGKAQALTSLPYYQGSTMHALYQANEVLGSRIDQLYAKLQEQAADPMKMGAVQGQYGQFNSADTIIGNLQYNDAVYEYQNDVGGFPASMLGRLFGVQEVEPFA